MLGTKRCDRCWELERRIRQDPALARKILDGGMVSRRLQDAVRDFVNHVRSSIEAGDIVFRNDIAPVIHGDMEEIDAILDTIGKGIL